MVSTPSSLLHTRRLGEDDLPAVAALFAEVFRAGLPVQTSSLIDHMRALYLGGPWFDPGLCSLVHLDEGGRIDGFLGVVAMPMRWQGRPLRAGITGTWMVRNPAQNAMATLRLARAYLAGPQDLSVSDTLNRISLDLAQELKYAVLSGDSLEWTRVLRPAGFGQAMLRAQGRPRLARLASCLATLADRSTRRFVSLPDPGVDDAAVEPKAFIAHAQTLAVQYEVRPDWDGPGLEWLLRLAAQQRFCGTLELRAIHKKNGKLAGVYALYGGRGRIAVALQVLCRPGMAARVIGSMCRRATEAGAVGVRGQTHPALIDGLIRTHGVFYRHRAATVVHSRDPALIEIARRGDMLVGGFVGDSWTRLATDQFD